MKKRLPVIGALLLSLAMLNISPTINAQQSLGPLSSQCGVLAPAPTRVSLTAPSRPIASPGSLPPGNWTIQRMGTPTFGFTFVDADHGWARSAVDGAIFRTADGGQTWDSVKLGRFWTTHRIAEMVFPSSEEGWIIGSAEYYDVMGLATFVAHTTDGGATWVEQIPGFTTGFYDPGRSIFFLDNSHGWALSSSRLWRTDNGGQTWIEAQPTSIPDRLLRFVDLSTGFGLEEDNDWPPQWWLKRTDDGGLTWTSVSSLPEWEQSIQVVAGGQAMVVVGDGGQIARSSDGGVSWQSVPSPTSHGLTQLSFVDSRHGWAAGVAGVLLQTDDGGQSWTLLNSGTNLAISSLAAAYPDHLWVYAGGLRRSLGGGLQWETLPAVRGLTLYSIRMGVETVGWASGSDPYVIYTDNAGCTWSDQIGVAGGNIQVEAVDASHAWTRLSCGLMATLDSGQTWTWLSSANGLIDFVDPQRGWQIRRGEIYHTEDGGRTWTSQTGAYPPWSNYSIVWRDIDFVDQQHGFVIGATDDYPNRRLVLATDDGGANWRTLLLSNPINMYNGDIAIDFIDTARGWAIFNEPSCLFCPHEIRRTVDGGATWQLAYPHSGLYTDVSFANALEGWVVGYDGHILHTDDGGVTWVSGWLPQGFDLFAVQAIGPGRAWIVGDNGLILSYSAEAPPTCGAGNVYLPVILRQ